MFNTLRKTGTAIMEKETQFCYVVNNFIMTHRSVNGIVTGRGLQEIYELIFDKFEGRFDI